MIKKVFFLFIVLSLMFIVGCSEVSELTKGLTNKSSQESLDIIRETKLGTEWQAKQMEIELAAEDEVAILMKLASGDKVDGYFYLENGKNIDFQITGYSLIYESQVPNNDESEGITSDRFSFIADKAQGDTYTLTFLNDDNEDKIKVFMEVIYPTKASLFLPIANK
ncbi:hypothetical protein ACFLWZ_01400 [Chloroflexota bacterium]